MEKVSLLENEDLSFFFNCTFSITINPPYTFFPLQASPAPLQLPHCCPWVLFLFCWIPAPTQLPRAVSLLSIYESVSICVLVQFVHWIPHVRETICYLTLSDWLISLSIMFSRSICGVAKCKILFLFTVKYNSIE